jgi:hypothetical protein
MRPQRIDHLGPLPHQQIARSMLHQLTLLLRRLDAHETHGGAPHRRLADRLGVSGIILVTLDISSVFIGRVGQLRRKWSRADVFAASIPSAWSRSDEALEQEFNVRYVIETRAKSELYFVRLENFNGGDL